MNPGRCRMAGSCCRWSCLCLFSLMACCLVTGGCGQAFGAFLYQTGLYHRPTVDAEFTLTEGPLLILIDDDQELLPSARIGDLLGQELARQLEENEVNANIIPAKRVKRMRLSDPRFERRGCREVGKELGAEQVIHLQVRDYVGTTEIESITNSARFSVVVKVINAQAEEASEVRLWPMTGAGQLVTASLTSNQLQKLKTEDAIAKRLARDLAATGAKLFYDHPLEEDEK